jgi:hypothetical protein
VELCSISFHVNFHKNAMVLRMPKSLSKLTLICVFWFQDWEDGLSKHNTDVSFLHVERNSNLRLFSFDDNGAYNLLKVHIMQCIIMLN